ncbi:hypothetical protein A1D31_22555 [Bradyrhizobium liaoningense]|nr:hypothetical protein A1D31_22555 [Bradyrhizobium liaoningense]
MTDINGQQSYPEVAAELLELAARNARQPSIRVRESTQPSLEPFDQEAHDLLLKSIDQVATDWIEQLENVRQNSKAVEQLVLERAAKVRADITALYLLGAAAQAEAKRGNEVNARLTDELDKLMEQHAG